uniref:Transmembrane protein 208 n=1 Tax=Minutocellus polymorphus TaxID=265543 RepID=A0A7S0AFH1_9STRA
MANAAAKKAAHARAAATATYLPIVGGINILHLLLRLYQWDDFTSSRSTIVLNALLLLLTMFAYKGILNDHADSASKSTTKVVGGGKANEKLAGGASLDLLGLVVLVQFGSALISDKFYWLLAILPFWGAYKIYTMVYGAKDLMGGGSGGGGGYSSSMAPTASENSGTGDAAEERRKKRAERRRMKRG